MIAFIQGKVHSYGLDHVIIENNGVGYRIYFGHPEVLTLNKEIMIFTYQHVREDEISLFGFISEDEYALFMKLIAVKGLGPKTALNILSFIGAEALIKVIEKEDIAQLKRLPGIGTKTASQIILDLKGKLVDQNKDNETISDDINDTMIALKTLGYKASELQSLPSELMKHPNLKTEEYIKMALQILHGRKGG
jgi:Holliday junction DNA helicase RuvA